YLADRLLEVSPADLLVLRKRLDPQREHVTGRLWKAAADGAGTSRQPMRALASLATLDPDHPTWDNDATLRSLSTDLIAELIDDPKARPYWSKAFKPQSKRLRDSLARPYRSADRESRRAAAALLADWVDEPEHLVNLLKDADEEQFEVLFPKLSGP